MNDLTVMEAAVLSDLNRQHLDPFDRAARMLGFLAKHGWKIERRTDGCGPLCPCTITIGDDE